MNNIILALMILCFIGCSRIQKENSGDNLNNSDTTEAYRQDTTAIPIVPIESIVFDINRDDNFDTITLYQYTYGKYTTETYRQDTTAIPIVPIESIVFDINRDDKFDTITLYQYTYGKYKDSEFQIINIKLANSSRLYCNLPEPYDFLDSIFVSNYSLINSKRLLICEIDSNYYMIISSKLSDKIVGYSTIFSVFANNINISLDERLIVDSIVQVNDNYYRNAIFARIQNGSSLELKNVIYVIPDAKSEDPIQFNNKLTKIYFN